MIGALEHILKCGRGVTHIANYALEVVSLSNKDKALLLEMMEDFSPLAPPHMNGVNGL